MKKLLGVLLTIAVFVCTPLPNANAGATDYEMDYDPQADAVLLVNYDTGTVVYEKNATGRIYPASTTKIMSTALAMTLCSDLENTMVTVSQEVIDEFYGIDISSAGLVAGETLSMYDMIHCMLLQSANEAASAVAEYFGRDDFIAQMNRKAQELGCKDTHFVNPHGLYDDQHYTTAEDMYLITSWAMSIPGFWEISQKARYTIDPTNQNPDSKTLSTTILMQDPNSYYYTDYIQGIKTGTIPQSKRCLVSAATKGGTTYILILMGSTMETTSQVWSDASSVFNETRVIYDWAFSSLRIINVASPDSVVTEIPLRYAKEKDSLLLYCSTDVPALVSRSYETEPEITFENITIPEKITAPVEAGEVIGTATVKVDGAELCEIELISRETIELNRFTMVMDTLGDIFTSRAAQIVLGLILLVVIVYVYYIFVVVRRAKSKQRKQNAPPTYKKNNRKSKNTSAKGSNGKYKKP